MAKKFSFTSAYVRQAAIAFAGKDGSKTVRVDFTMGWTEKVRSAMGWAELSEDQSEVGLKGSMNVLEMTMEVAEKAFDFGSGVLKNFKAVRVGDEKKSSIELRAQHVTHERTVGAKVESYGENASRAKGSLRISYEWVGGKDGSDGGEQQTLAAE